MALVDAPPADLLATAAAQPHDPGFVPFVRRAQAAGIPIEIVSDGFGFFIEPALEALGVGELPVVTARDHLRGSARVDRLPERPPDLPHLRHLQAQPRPRPPGRRPRRRVHRRRRERPLRRGLRRRRLGQALARPHLHRGRLAVPPLDASSARSTAGWRTTLDGLARRSGRPCPARRPPVLLRPGGLGRGPRRPAARRVAAILRRRSDHLTHARASVGHDVDPEPDGRLARRARGAGCGWRRTALRAGSSGPITTD